MSLVEVEVCHKFLISRVLSLSVTHVIFLLLSFCRYYSLIISLPMLQQQVVVDSSWNLFGTEEYSSNVHISTPPAKSILLSVFNMQIVSHRLINHRVNYKACMKFDNKSKSNMFICIEFWFFELKQQLKFMYLPCQELIYCKSCIGRLTDFVIIYIVTRVSTF